MHTNNVCHLCNLNVGRKRYPVSDLSQTLEIHEGQVFPELIPPICWRDKMDPVHHVQVMITGVLLVGHLGVLISGPGNHLRTELAREELVYQPC